MQRICTAARESISRRAIFVQHLPEYIGLMRVTYVKQIREDVLLLVAEDVPMRMVPVRHLHAAAVPPLGLEG